MLEDPGSAISRIARMITLRAIAIADTDPYRVGRLTPPSVDLLLSLGDHLGPTIEKAAERYRPARTLAVRGNHDSPEPLPPCFTSLHLSAEDHDLLVIENHQGIRFAGFNGSWRYKPRGWHLFDQERVSRVLDALPVVDVFLAHNSPRGFHERDEDVHQGFEAFLAYIRRARPRYFLHGHQHVNRTTVLSHAQDGMGAAETTLIGVYGEAYIEMEFP